MDGLGIDWKILLLQVVNFLVLLWLLKRFVYKPFLAMLQKRQKRIEEGVKKSEEAEKSLAKIRALAQEVEAANERKAREVVVAAEHKVQEKTRQMMAAAEEERKKAAEAARLAIERERVQARESQQKESVDMAFAVAEKFLKEKIDKAADKALIEKLASQIK